MEASTCGHPVLSLPVHEDGIVLPPNPLVRTHTLLAVALGVRGYVVVLGDEFAGCIVVSSYNHVPADHLRLSIAAGQPERHVLVLPYETRQPDLYILAEHLPFHLHASL